MTDGELVDRARAGFEDAFRLLVDRHGRAVYNLLARMLRDPALAEDLAQETFLRAFTHLSSFDPRYKFSNWVLRIAHNLAIDALRRRRGSEVVSLDSTEGERPPLVDSIPDARAEDGPARLERGDLAEALARAMDRLRPEYRQLVVLRYQEELSYEEIVEVTGLPLGTVKSFLHRARKEMAQALEAGGWREGDGGSGQGRAAGRPE